MEDKELEELSTGAAVYIQGFAMAFCLLMIAVIAFIMPFRSLDFEGYLFLFLVFSLLILFALIPLIYSDIYLSGSNVVMKKIFGTKRRPVSDFKAINSAILPFAWYIEFKDGKKVYFSLTPMEMVKNFFGADIIKKLGVRIEERMTK